MTPPGTRKVVLATNFTKMCARWWSEAVATAALRGSREALLLLMESPDPDDALHHRCFLRLLDHARVDGRLTIVLHRCGSQWWRRVNAMRMTTPRDMVCSVEVGPRFQRTLALGAWTQFLLALLESRPPSEPENAFGCQAHKIWDRGLIQRCAGDLLEHLQAGHLNQAPIFLFRSWLSFFMTQNFHSTLAVQPNQAPNSHCDRWDLLVSGS
jgi:hypothetical protein